MPYDLSVPCLLKVKGHDPKYWKSNISQMAQDKEFVSYENHYKVAYELSNKVEIFDLCLPWKVKVTDRNLIGISHKRYDIERLYQQKTIMKSHMNFPKKWNGRPLVTLEGQGHNNCRDLCFCVQKFSACLGMLFYLWWSRLVVWLYGWIGPANKLGLNHYSIFGKE